MNNSALIHSIFVGQPKTITDARGTWRSSLYRDRVDGPVQVEIGGLVGDKVTQSYHGGPDSTLCVQQRSKNSKGRIGPLP
jgi:MOSC domain-containing protein YiiM